MSSQQAYFEITVDDKSPESPELNEEDPISEEISSTPILSWKNLSVTSTQFHNKILNIADEKLFENRLGTKPSGINILKNISGQIEGGLWAIMGESGSGKTTLLNALARRLDLLRMQMTGETAINGRNYTENNLKSFAGYVMQDDLVNARFTVEETLYYNAALRLSCKLNKEERTKRIHEIMHLLEIEHVKDILVGDSRHKGISGGERKRLCVAIELLAKPTLLFLDEPTTGLDSSTARHLMTVLHSLAEKKECTILTTIHQPPTKIFSLIDNLILLRNGECLFHGKVKSAMDHFANLGFPCPENENFADHIINIISANTHDLITGEEIASPVPVAIVDIDIKKGIERTPPPPRIKTPWHLQFYYLIQRGFLEQFRNVERFLIGIVAVLVLSTFIGDGVWHHVGDYQNSIELRRPALFFVAVSQGIVSSFLGCVSFPMDRALMLRERHAGTYRVSAYFLAKTTVETIVEIPQLVIFTLMTYFLFGLRPGGNHFMIYAVFLVLGNIAAMALTNAISCLAVSVQLATVVIAFTMEISRLYGGWFLNPIQLRDFKEWQFFSATAYVKYMFFGITLNEFTDLPLKCRPSELKNGVCPVTNGSQVTHQYGYDLFDISFCIEMLVVIIIVYKLVAFLALKYIKI